MNYRIYEDYGHSACRRSTFHLFVTFLILWMCCFCESQVTWKLNYSENSHPNRLTDTFPPLPSMVFLPFCLFISFSPLSSLASLPPSFQPHPFVCFCSSVNFPSCQMCHLLRCPFSSSTHTVCFPSFPVSSFSIPPISCSWVLSHFNNRSMIHSWRKWRLLRACRTFVTPSSSTGARLKRRQKTHLSLENLRSVPDFVRLQQSVTGEGVVATVTMVLLLVSLGVTLWLM